MSLFILSAWLWFDSVGRHCLMRLILGLTREKWSKGSRGMAGGLFKGRLAVAAKGSRAVVASMAGELAAKGSLVDLFVFPCQAEASNSQAWVSCYCYWISKNTSMTMCVLGLFFVFDWVHDMSMSGEWGHYWRMGILLYKQTIIYPSALAASGVPQSHSSLWICITQSP
jgi:hypothetical protein